MKPEIQKTAAQHNAPVVGTVTHTNFERARIEAGVPLRSVKKLLPRKSVLKRNRRKEAQ